LNSINTNASAIQGLQALNAASSGLAHTESRVATGLAVSAPQDDGVTWAIAQNMRSQTSAWQTVASGLNRAQSIIDAAASGANEIETVLQSIKASALSLSESSLDSNSQATLTANIQQLVSQIDQIAGSATFDGVNLLVPNTEPPITLTAPTGGPDPTLSFSTPVNGHAGLITMDYSFYNVDPNAPDEPTLSAAGVTTNTSEDYGAPSEAGQTEALSTTFQYGDWSDFSVAPASSVSFDFATHPFPTPAPPASPPPAAYGVTVQSLTLTPFTTQATVAASPNGANDNIYYSPMTSDWLGLSDLASLAPDEILSAVNGALDQVNASAQQMGDQQNMLTNQAIGADNMQAALTKGVGTLVDANMAAESANLQAETVKQQLAATTMSIANDEPKILLSLFRS
jgi:flagellin